MSAAEASLAEKCSKDRNLRNYAALAEQHLYKSITVETIGVYGGFTGVILTLLLTSVPDGTI